jgi:hypothetical protein
MGKKGMPHMPHLVDGFEVAFTSRRSWKATLRCHGRLIDTVPVTWTKGRWQTGPDVFQAVWFQNADELEAYRTSSAPFRVALAIAKDYAEHPHQFQEFRGIFEVQATGEQLSETSIQTRVLRRFTAREALANA